MPTREECIAAAAAIALRAAIRIAQEDLDAQLAAEANTPRQLPPDVYPHRMVTSSGLTFMPELPPAPEPALEEATVGPHEMAIYLGAHVGTVRRYASSGEIPAVKVGGRWRFYLSDVRAHLTAPKTSGQWNQSNQSRGRRRLT